MPMVTCVSQKLFITLLYLSIFILALGILRGQHSIVDFFDLKQSKKILQETVSKLEQENQALNMEITKIRKSPSYAQKVLRDKYHVVDENESIIFFAD